MVSVVRIPSVTVPAWYCSSPSIPPGDKYQPGEVVYKPQLPLRSSAGSPGDIYQSYVSQKGNAAAMNIC